MSSSGELALALGTHARGIMTYGTLARVPLSGGAPRELHENVKYADWLPTARPRDRPPRRRARSARVSRWYGGRAAGDARGRIQLPPRLTRAAMPSRRSSWSRRSNLFGRVVVVDRAGKKRAMSRQLLQRVRSRVERRRGVVHGGGHVAPLSQHHLCDEHSGDVRIVARVPGNTSTPRHRARWSPAHRADRRSKRHRRSRTGRRPERDLSWHDATPISPTSPATAVRCSSTRVRRRRRTAPGSVYLRGADGPPAVRLGDGYGHALSPDGRWASVQKNNFQEPFFQLFRRCAGQASRLARPGLNLIRARWLPDGQSVVALGEQAGQRRFYVLDLGGESMWVVTPESFTAGNTEWAVSPDGAMLETHRRTRHRAISG